jgi:hypothetical protein
MSEAPKYVEYEPSDDSGYWRMERPDLLEADFGAKREDVEEWHRFIAGRGRVWEIVRLLYQAGSMDDEDPDLIVSWNRAEVAKKFGIPVAEVEHEIVFAAGQWKLAQARAEVSAAASTIGEDEIGQLEQFANAANLGKSDVDRLLESFSFGDLRGELLRAQVANRIISLRSYLESPHSRTSARQLIRMEVSLHAKEKMLLIYNNKIEAITTEDPELKVKDKELDGFRQKAKELDEEIRKITKAHSDLQESIGADDIDMTTRKRIFVETVAYLMDKCREYESNPENVLVDGVFRANEIDWLLEPLGERTPQYRPDISVRLRDALLPENLWDPHYKPPKIALRVCQELRKIVAGMRAIPEDAEPLMDVEDDEDDVTFSENSIPVMEDMAAPTPVLIPGAGSQESKSMGIF